MLSSRRRQPTRQRPAGDHAGASQARPRASPSLFASRAKSTSAVNDGCQLLGRTSCGSSYGCRDGDERGADQDHGGFVAHARRRRGQTLSRHGGCHGRRRRARRRRAGVGCCNVSRQNCHYRECQRYELPAHESLSVDLRGFHRRAPPFGCFTAVFESTSLLVQGVCHGITCEVTWNARVPPNRGHRAHVVGGHAVSQSSPSAHHFAAC